MGKFKRAGPASPQSPNKRHKTNDGEEAAASSQSSIKMDELELGAEPLEQGASGKLNEPGGEGESKSEDLNYDEYDLSEECDMVVRCKSCDTVFMSLEKFITHKKSSCKGRKTAAKSAAGTSESEDTSFAELISQMPSKADDECKDKETNDITISPAAEMLSKPVTRVYSSRRGRGQKPKTTSKPVSKTTLSLSDFTSDLLSDQPALIHTAPFIVCSPPRTSTESIDITDRIKAPTLPDEVERISDMSTHDNIRFTNRHSNKGKDSLKSAEPEPEYNIDDLVTVSVNYDDDDSDPELPVDVKPITLPKISSPPREMVEKEVASPAKELTPYRLVEVLENTSTVLSQPRLGFTFEQLKSVKTLNLMNPLPPPQQDVQTLMADGSLLGPVQTVLASSKDEFSLKLLLRRVIQPASEIKLDDKVGADVAQLPNTDSADKPVENNGKENDQVEDNNQSIDSQRESKETDQSEAAGFNMWASEHNDKIQDAENEMENMEEAVDDIITFEDLEKSEQSVDEMKQEMDLKDDDDEEEYAAMEFEHDPDLYEYLRDDEYYTLGPKLRGRLACVDIKSRTDCDWQTRRCFRCNTLYSCIKTLTNHMSYQHADKKVFYPCIYCRNIYSQQKNLSRHLNKTHGKSLEFVAKLRAFVRNQAFVRQLKVLDYNSEKLTEENDPFLRNMRRRVPPTTPTRYCKVSDKEMIAKFGRKLRMIGRPPGRPTRTKNTNISLTCTICEAPVQTAREMLRHLKETHSFSQKAISKLRPKLFAKVQEVAVEERLKVVEREKELAASRFLALESKLASEGRDQVIIKDFNIDSYGRLVINKQASPLKRISQASNQSIRMATKSYPSKAGLQSQFTAHPRIVKPLAPEPTIVSTSIASVPSNEKRQPTNSISLQMCLTQCPTCQKIFVNQNALDKHTPSCLPAEAAQSTGNSQVFEIAVHQNATQQLIVDQGTIRPAMSHMVVEHAPPTQQTTELMEEQPDFSNLTTEGEMVGDNELYLKVIKESGSYVEGASGLDTLAMISTNEANKAESPQVHTLPTVHQSLAGEADTVIHTDLTADQSDDLQTVTLTEEQLEQIKAAGGNIIYLVKSPSGGLERIDTPQGMEVVEISQITDGHTMYNV